jgi:hypothetical protein
LGQDIPEIIMIAGNSIKESNREKSYTSANAVFQSGSNTELTPLRKSYHPDRGRNPPEMIPPDPPESQIVGDQLLISSAGESAGPGVPQSDDAQRIRWMVDIG